MIVVILLVVLIFSLLVFVHEFGHFITARRGGIEVEEFGFGFPPRVFGIKRGRTLYSLNLIPFGGFVKMKGEDGADVSPGSFGGASFGRKLAVLLAGVGMNLLVAYVLFVYLAAAGLPGSVRQDLNLPRPESETPKRVIVLDMTAGSPADTGGVERGDVIISADARAIGSEKELIEYNKSRAGQLVTYQIERAGEQRELAIQLRDGEEAEKNGYLGVTPLQISEARYGWRSPLVAAEATAKTVWLTISGFVGAVGRMFVTQQVGSNVAGPIGVVVILSNIVYLGLNYVLFFVATISVSLAALNVLPIPALDGGRVAVLLAGKAIGKPVSPRIEGIVHTIGFVLLLLFMLMVTVVDIQRLL